LVPHDLVDLKYFGNYPEITGMSSQGITPFEAHLAQSGRLPIGFVAG
jgi:hypothetical protein